MVDSSPSRQRRPPYQITKGKSDEAADPAALTYLLTQAPAEKTLETYLMGPIEFLESVLMEDLSEDTFAWEHWNKYWNAVSVPSDDEWPEGWTEDREKLFLNNKLLVPEDRVVALIDHWHNAQFMHPGRHTMQPDLEWTFEFPPGYCAILNRYFNHFAVCRAMINLNHSTAGNLV